MKLAEQADAAEVPDRMSIPEELERREARLQALGEAKRKIETRVQEREQAEYEAKLEARTEPEQRTGKKPRGPPPTPTSGKVDDKEQIDLTDEASRITPMAGVGFEQRYNAQAAVATDSLLIVAHDLTQAANDKQQLVPVLDRVKVLLTELGRTRTCWPTATISAKPM